MQVLLVAEEDDVGHTVDRRTQGISSPDSAAAATFFTSGLL